MVINIQLFPHRHIISCQYKELTCSYLLIPRRKVLLEKLTGFQIVKKIPALYGTQRFITVFTSVRYLSLS